MGESSGSDWVFFGFYKITRVSDVHRIPSLQIPPISRLKPKYWDTLRKEIDKNLHLGKVLTNSNVVVKQKFNPVTEVKISNKREHLVPEMCQRLQHTIKALYFCLYDSINTINRNNTMQQHENNTTLDVGAVAVVVEPSPDELLFWHW